MNCMSHVTCFMVLPFEGMYSLDLYGNTISKDISLLEKRIMNFKIIIIIKSTKDGNILLKICTLLNLNLGIPTQLPQA